MHDLVPPSYVLLCDLQGSCDCPVPSLNLNGFPVTTPPRAKCIPISTIPMEVQSQGWGRMACQKAKREDLEPNVIHL